MARSPRLPLPARALLRVLVPAGLRAEVEGDLAERYREVRRGDGRLAAYRWLVWQLASLDPMGLRRGGRRSTLDTRNAGGGIMDGGWGADLKQGLRALRVRPAAALTVVATVALAVGATTAVYTVVDGVLLRPLPYPDSDRLVRVWQTKESWRDSPNSQLRSFAERFPVSVPTFFDWQDANTGFASVGAYGDASYVLQGPDGAEVVRGQRVTSGYFETLRVLPAVGRRVQATDDAPGAGAVVVLSDAFWHERFGGRADALGESLNLDGTPHTVVGVMPAGFRPPTGSPTLWASFSEEEKTGERDSQWLTVIGRLDEGVTREMAAERLATVQVGLAEAYPDAHGDLGSRVVSLLDAVVGGVRTTLWFLLGAVGLVLLIATVNIANILTVSGLARRRELAVRAAMGAGTWRLTRGLFVESAVLAGVGGAAGIVAAWSSLPLLLRVVPTSVPRHEAISVSPGVLVFGLALTGLTACLVGTLPALLAARAHPQEMLRGAGRGHTGGRTAARVRSTLVAGEVALAFVLLVGAGLLANSYSRLWSVERGFATEGLVAMSAVPDPAEYPEREDRARFVRELRDRLDGIPGVLATATNQIPLSGSSSTTTYYVERPEGEPQELNVMISVVLENYHDLMGIPIVAGRGFTTADGAEAPLVGIVNETRARAYWPAEDPIGKRVRSDHDEPWAEIVGVAADLPHMGLDDEVDSKLYVPAAQNHRSTNAWVLRIQGDLTAATDLARREVSALSPATPVRRSFVLEETIARSVAVPRFRTMFVVGLAGLAAVLALLGVYGVLSFAVTQRTREIGVRMALGARTRGVVRDVVGSGLRLAAVGVVVGLLIAWRSAGLAEEFLFQVAPTDVPTYVVMVLSVLLVSGLAAYLPARRAAAVDPVRVLNAE